MDKVLRWPKGFYYYARDEDGCGYFYMDEPYAPDADDEEWSPSRPDRSRWRRDDEDRVLIDEDTDWRDTFIRRETRAIDIILGRIIK